MLITEGDIFRFNTNEASIYGANVNCLVTYKRLAPCDMMRVSCDQFSLASGDILRVTRVKKYMREYKQT